MKRKELKNWRVDISNWGDLFSSCRRLYIFTDNIDDVIEVKNTVLKKWYKIIEEKNAYNSIIRLIKWKKYFYILTIRKYDNN